MAKGQFTKPIFTIHAGEYLVASYEVMFGLPKVVNVGKRVVWEKPSKKQSPPELSKTLSETGHSI